MTATGCAKHHGTLPPGPASYALRHGREAPAPATPVGHAIHVVGPDLRVGAPTWDGGSPLATACRNALAEFDASELPTLRLPISGAPRPVDAPVAADVDELCALLCGPDR